MSKINVRKRGNGWQYRFEIAPVAGKRKEKSKGGFRTKAEALQAGAKAYTEYNECGVAFTPAELSVSDYLEYWYNNYCISNLRPNTLAAYRGTIDNHLKPALGSYKLKSLRPDAIQQFVNELKARGLSRNWVKNIKATLSGALDYAVYPCEYLKDNPCRYVKTPKFDKAQAGRTVVTEDNWERIQARFKDSRFYVPLMIGYYCGMRISEVLALTWADVDFEKRQINVDKQLLCDEGQYKLAPPKTDSGVRVVDFGESLYTCLVHAKKHVMACESVYGEHYVRYYIKDDNIYFAPASMPLQEQPIHFVCVSDGGELTTSNSFKYASRVIHYDLGIKDFCFHSLRHTHATILAEAGANPTAVKDRLGHHSIKTTLDIYTKATAGMKSDAAILFEKSAVNRRAEYKNSPDKRG